MPDSAPSLARRAALAIALLLGFYVLAFGLAAVLLFLPYAEWRWVHRLDLRLLILGVGGGCVILYSALPRSEAFRAPGPRLHEEEQPRLFALLHELAERMGQSVPPEVYLVHDVNAWVAQRGTVLGAGGRRYMGLGLPLLQVLDVSELRGVLAHEFGHYDGGDTRLGTFVYQARVAIGRTIAHLQKTGGAIRELQTPFIAYGNFFLRKTQRISRAQESRADLLAAEIAGPNALAGGLRKIHAYDRAYQAYVNNEYASAIGMRVLPPLGDGFARFLAAPVIRPQVAEMCEDIVALERQRASEDPPEALAYESHPRLPERLEAIAGLGLPDQPEDATPAVALLDDVPGLDAEMSRSMLREDLAEELDDASWDEVGTVACLPHYRAQAGQVAAILRGEPVLTLYARWPALRERILGWMRTLPDGAAPTATRERRALASWLLGAAMAVTLADRGSVLVSLPGEPTVARGPQGDILPFELARVLEKEERSEEQWQDTCRRIGFAETLLPGPAPPAGAAAGAVEPDAAPVAGS